MSPAPVDLDASSKPVMALMQSPGAADSYAWLSREAYLELAGFAYDLARRHIVPPPGEPAIDGGVPWANQEDFRNLVVGRLGQALDWYGYQSAVLLKPVFPRDHDDRARFARVAAQVSKWESRRKQLRSHGTAQREAGRYE